jgi:hypothetical protein
MPAAHREDDGLAIYEPVEENHTLVRDYGVIVRTVNPFLSEGRTNKKIVIIYGCYGFGSLAAVLFSMEREFLKNITNTDKDIECIVACDIVDETPQTIRRVYFEEHPPGSLYSDMLANRNKRIATAVD